MIVIGNYAKNVQSDFDVLQFRYKVVFISTQGKSAVCRQNCSSFAGWLRVGVLCACKCAAMCGQLETLH